MLFRSRYYWVNREYLHDYVVFDTPKSIGGAFGSEGVALGSGTLKLVFRLDDGSKSMITLKDAYYAPKLGVNLISAGRLHMAGVQVASTCSRYTLSHENGAAFGYVKINDLGSMFVQASFVRAPNSLLMPIDSALIIMPPADRERWHSRGGHASATRLDQWPGMVDGIEFANTLPLPACKVCSLGSITRKPVLKIAAPQAARPLQLLSTDTWGPARVSFLGGYGYLVASIDAYSRYMHGDLEKLKSDGIGHIMRYVEAAEAQTDYRCGTICSDKGELVTLVGEAWKGRRVSSPNWPIRASQRRTASSSELSARSST